MDSNDLVMVFDKPHFIVKLHQTSLEVDFTEGVRKKLEDFLESNPHLKESIGVLLQNVIHLDVRLKNIETVCLDEKGHVKIVIPHRRDVTIPLEKDESVRLADKLNELIPIEKTKEAERIESERARQTYPSFTPPRLS